MALREARWWSTGKITTKGSRHSTVTMTQNAYIKTVSADAATAMKTIEAICAANYATNMQPGTEKEPVSTTQ
jgi:hypothetical protein